jgi:hypothetical protein
VGFGLVIPHKHLIDMGEKIYFADFDIGIEINIRPIFIDQFENFKLYDLVIIKIDGLC